MAQLLCVALIWRAFGAPRLETDDRAYRAFVWFALFLTELVESVTNTRNYFFFCEHCKYLLFWTIFPATTEIAAISRPVTQYDAMFICIKTMITTIHVSNIVIAWRRREFSRYSSRLKWSSGWFTGPVDMAHIEKSNNNNWMAYFPSRKYAKNTPAITTKREKKKHLCSVLQW